MMEEARKNLEKATDDLFTLFMVNCSLSDIANADESTLKTIQAVAKFMKASNELIREQTEMIEEMNKMLHKLVSREA